MELDEYYEVAHSNKHSQVLVNVLFKTVDLLWEDNEKNPINVVDSGCGSGVFCDILLRNYNSEVIDRIYGLDIEKWVSEDLLAHNRFVFTYPEDLSSHTAKKKPDITVSFDVIEHIEDDVGYVKGISDSLANNGIFMVFTPNTNRINKLVFHKLFGVDYTYPKVMSTDYINDAKVNHIHVREYDHNSLKDLLSDSFPYVFSLPIFVGLKLPRAGFVGSYNRFLNEKLYNYVDHLLFICTKSPTTLELLQSSL